MGLKSTSSPWKCFIVLKLIGRLFWGSKLLNQQIFMEPGILTIPAYSLGVLIEVEFGREKPSNFPGKKKTPASDWNGTSFASDSLVATKRWPKRCRIWGGWCVERDPKYWAFLQRKIQRGSISLPLYPQELAFWSQQHVWLKSRTIWVNTECKIPDSVHFSLPRSILFVSIVWVATMRVFKVETSGATA